MNTDADSQTNIKKNSGNSVEEVQKGGWEPERSRKLQENSELINLGTQELTKTESTTREPKQNWPRDSAYM